MKKEVKVKENKSKKDTVKTKTTTRKKEVKRTNTIEKKSISKSNMLILVAFIFLALGIIIGLFVNGNKNNIIKTKDKEFVKVYNDIKKNYYGEIKEDFDDKTIVSMVRALEDPYGAVYEGIDAVNYKENLNNKFIGIGTEVVMNENNEIIFVTVFNDSPAEKAGVMVNDRLIKVNDTDVTGMTLLDTTSLIKGGNEKDIVEITVLRDNEEIVLSIEKSVIIRDTVIVEYLNDNIAKVTINYFSNTTYQELKDKLDEIKEKGIKKVALDLRNNDFGKISVAKDIADLFLEKGKIIYKEETKSGTIEYYANSIKEYDFDMVLVTNEFTYKASEMLAYSLIDNLGIKVIGKKTANNNSIQKSYELKNNSIIEYTIGKWLSPNGNDIKEKEINIDYEVDDCDVNNKIIEVLSDTD